MANALARSDKDDDVDEGFSRKSRVISFLKSYGWHLGAVALELGVPALMFIAASAAVDGGDPERFGLGWLQWTRLDNDLKRETVFPPHMPSSPQQRHRLEAARAAEQVVVASA